MLVSSYNLSQSFNYMTYLFYKKTVQIRDKFFLFMDPAWAINFVTASQSLSAFQSTFCNCAK